MVGDATSDGTRTVEVHAERSYHIIEKIGEGSFGSVYRGEMVGQAGFRKPVALKMMRNDRVFDEQLVMRQRDEARLMGMVSHRAIVNVHALVELDSSWTVVMEYVGGASVQQVLNASGKLPPGAALELIAEVADALDSAWRCRRPNGTQLRLQHRDIKPSNLQLTQRGEVKLLDFGIAKADFVGRESKTEGILLGTIRYMGPERLEGVDGPEGDVYALGATMIALLLGRSVPRTSAVRSKHEKHLTEVQAQLEHLPPTVSQLAMSMLAYDPADRPDAHQVARAAHRLRRMLDGPTLQEWANVAVPVAEQKSARPDPDGLVGKVLQETTGAGPEATLRPGDLQGWDSAESTSTTRTGLVAAAATSVVATLMLGASTVAVLLLVGWFWLGGIGPVDPPAAVAPVATPSPISTRPLPSPRAKPAVVRPAPPRPAPAATPAPAVPTPPKAPPATGSLTIEGDAHQVVLRGPSGTVASGALPPGSYDVLVAFEEGASLRPGPRVEVLANGATTVECWAAFNLCSVH